MISPVSGSSAKEYGYLSVRNNRLSDSEASAQALAKADSALNSVKTDSAQNSAKAESAQKLNNSKCETCQSRKYQDVSDDPGVSFQTPTNVSPEASAAAVSGHEGEHVSRERSKASSEGREVVSQTVTLTGGICPECGKTYVAGGETRTVTRQVKDPNPDLGKLLDTYQ
jgi:hypothetical protein